MKTKRRPTSRKTTKKSSTKSKGKPIPKSAKKNISEKRKASGEKPVSKAKKATSKPKKNLGEKMNRRRNTRRSARTRRAPSRRSSVESSGSMSRRRFLRTAGVGAAGVVGAAMMGSGVRANRAPRPLPMAVTAKSLKIGHIHVLDENASYSKAHIDGVNRAAAELGIPPGHIHGINNVADEFEDGGVACEAACRKLVMMGCHIIFADSFGHGNPMFKVAAEYPNVAFCHATGAGAKAAREDPEHPLYNVSNYFGKVHQARFLSGIVAGMITQPGNNLGYVAAQAIPEVISGLSATFLGAKRVNDDVTMNFIVTYSWFCPKREEEAAQSLIDAYADVLGQHADSPTTQIVAQENGVYGIGYNSDMGDYETCNGDICVGNVASVIWNWKPAYYYFVKQLLDQKGALPLDVDYSGSLSLYSYEEDPNWELDPDGMVNIVYNDSVLGSAAQAAGTTAEDIKAEVELARDEILADNLHVFSGQYVRDAITDLDVLPIFDYYGYYPESVKDEYGSAPSWRWLFTGDVTEISLWNDPPDFGTECL